MRVYCYSKFLQVYSANMLNSIIDTLRPTIASTLRIPEGQLKNNEAFINYGVSSFTTLILTQKINKQFSIQIPLEDMTINLTVISLAELISTYQVNLSQEDSHA